MAITLLTINRWAVGQVVLPAYILAVNAALYAVIKVRTASTAVSSVDAVLST
jgi:hypothetical protein